MKTMPAIYPNLLTSVLAAAGSMLLALVLTGCVEQSDEARDSDVMLEGEPALKDVFAGSFTVGASLNEWQVTGRSPREIEIVEKHFSTVTTENALKWENVHPEPGRYDFDIADRIVEFGEVHGMTVIGHTLVWHNQTPRWVFEDGDGNPVSRDTLLARMQDHIATVVGRYRGRIDGWDVVNEPWDDDGALRDSPWRQIIGDDYIAKAFEYAYEADPDAGLYLNDYSLPNEARRDGAVATIKSLQEQGVPVTGIGMQGHYQLDWPSPEQLNSALEAFGALGIEVMITELDVNVLPQVSLGAEITDTVAWKAEIDPYKEGLPDEVQQLLALKYEELFQAFVEHDDVITRVTFWGVSDRSSWKNDWPVFGRTNYPLLFDREGKPKPAFYAVVDAGTP